MTTFKEVPIPLKTARAASMPVVEAIFKAHKNGKAIFLEKGSFPLVATTQRPDSFVNRVRNRVRALDGDVNLVQAFDAENGTLTLWLASKKQDEPN